jgi:hypothetical protein
MMEHTRVVGTLGKVPKETRGPNAGEMPSAGHASGLRELQRAVVAVVAFGLLMALWVMLWIPSGPVP